MSNRSLFDMGPTNYRILRIFDFPVTPTDELINFYCWLNISLRLPEKANSLNFSNRPIYNCRPTVI